MTQTNDSKPSKPITAVISCSSFIQALSSIHISCAGKSSGIVIVPSEVAEALTAHLKAFDPSKPAYDPAKVEELMEAGLDAVLILESCMKDDDGVGRVALDNLVKSIADLKGEQPTRTLNFELEYRPSDYFERNWILKCVRDSDKHADSEYYFDTEELAVHAACDIANKRGMVSNVKRVR